MVLVLFVVMLMLFMLVVMVMLLIFVVVIIFLPVIRMEDSLDVVCIICWSRGDSLAFHGQN